MKRLFTVILAAVMLMAMLPVGAVAEITQSHIIEADRVLVYNPLPYSKKENMLFSGTIPKPAASRTKFLPIRT